MKKLLGFILTGFLAIQVVAQNNYAIERDISYRDIKDEIPDEYMAERCKLDVYYPRDVENFATIIWIHGGGLQTGDKHFREEMMNKGMAIVAFNYRLYPKVKAPAYVDDAAAAAAWVFRNIERYGGDTEKIFIAGHSAGAYLASMIGLDKSYLGKYGIDADEVKAYFPLSGQIITHSTVREEGGLERTQPVIDELAPVHHARSDAPPFIVITGGRNEDLPARYEENVYFKRVMEMAGHENTKMYELEGFGHGSMVAPACSLVIEHINEILERPK